MLEVDLDSVKVTEPDPRALIGSAQHPPGLWTPECTCYSIYGAAAGTRTNVRRANATPQP